jgi:hypothetical protein
MGDDRSQFTAEGEQARLRPQSQLPSLMIGFTGSIVWTPPVSSDLRLTVEAARCKLLAISRIDRPYAMPREISSRSASVRVLAERRRTAGAIPPCCDNKKCIEPWFLSRARPISCSDSPALQRRQISVLCTAERPYRLLKPMQHPL